MMLNIISERLFHPLDSVQLGRFVTSVDYPDQDYHDPPYAEAPEGNLTLRGQYKNLHQGASSSGFTSKLIALMSSGFTKRAIARIRIETDQVRTYTLDNSES